jgi:hypothetical protein
MENNLTNIISIVYLKPENARFYKKDDFVAMTATVPASQEPDAPLEEKTFDRIYLHRAFPFDYPYEYISVIDKDNKEIGLISSIADFDDETGALLKGELERKYYTPKILKIKSIKERYGYAYWSVVTDAGDIDFTLRDTYRSMIKIEGGRIYITDIDGNRFEIENIESLDRQSYRKIELYL